MIAIEEIHRLFDIIVDKTASPYFTSGEKDQFINAGIRALVQKYFNPSQSHLMESTSIDVEDLQELIVPLKLTSDASGNILKSDIETGISSEYYYILNVAVREDGCGTDYKKCRFIRHNDYFAQKDNAFKKPDKGYTVYRIFSDKLTISPTGSVGTYLTLLKKPNIVTLDDPTDTGVRGANAVDCELNDKLLNEIVMLSCVAAGISMREGDFYQMTSVESIKQE